VTPRSAGDQPSDGVLDCLQQIVHAYENSVHVAAERSNKDLLYIIKENNELLEGQKNC